MNEKSFKCLEQITILSGELGDYAKQKDSCTRLLQWLESAGRNEVEEAITNIIEHAHWSADKAKANALINQVHTFLKEKNRNLWL